MYVKIVRGKRKLGVTSTSKFINEVSAKIASLSDPYLNIEDKTLTNF